MYMSKKKVGGYEGHGNTASEMRTKYDELSKTEEIDKIDVKHTELRSIIESIKSVFLNFDEHIKLVMDLGFLGNIYDDKDQKEKFQKNETKISDEINALNDKVEKYNNKDGNNEDDTQDDIDNLNKKFEDLSVLCKFISSGDKIKYNDEKKPDKKVEKEMETRFDEMSVKLHDLKLELPKEKKSETKGTEEGTKEETKEEPKGTEEEETEEKTKETKGTKKSITKMLGLSGLKSRLLGTKKGNEEGEKTGEKEGEENKKSNASPSSSASPGSPKSSASPSSPRSSASPSSPGSPKSPSSSGSQGSSASTPKTSPSKSIIFQIDGLMDPDTKKITSLTGISFLKDPKSKPLKVQFNANEIKDGKIVNDPNIAKSITNAIAQIGGVSIKTSGGKGRKTHRRHSRTHTRNTHKNNQTKSHRRLRRRTKNKIIL